jgi:flagellar hook-associated protein 1 FlgK
MSSMIGTYYLGYSGMSVNQTALATISHNLANVNTTGYSRQRVNTSELVNAGGVVGSGTTAESVTRLRNTMLDQTYRTENADLSYYEAKDETLAAAEELLGDFSATTSDDSADETGVQLAMEDFFDSWEELAKDLSSTSAQDTVLETAASLVDLLAELDSQLQQLQTECADQVYESVNSLNDLATQVASLNEQISRAEAKGYSANDLEDQRDALVDEMSNLTDLTVNVQTDGTYEVLIGGVYLVRGTQTHTLVVTGDGTSSDPLAVTWAETGKDAELASGSIEALLEEADQSAVWSIAESNLPYDFDPSSAGTIGELRQSLNALITTIAYSVNDLFSSGTALDGTTASGVLFFVNGDTDDETGMNISNIRINTELSANSSLLAVSASGEASDGGIATAIAELADSELLAADGLPKSVGDYYTAAVSWLATERETTEGLVATQDSLVTQTDTDRLAISSVSMEEELTKMITYQSAYSASAKYLNLVDGLVSDIISLIR